MKYAVLNGRRLLGGICIAFGVLCLVTLIFQSMDRLWAAKSVSAAQKKLPIYSVETQRKAVAIGINCAWDDADIPILLDLFRQRDLKVNFFVAGDWSDKFPESVRSLAEAGHEIGSHSNTHADMTTLSESQILEQIHRSEEKIERLTGKRPNLFRFPSGAYNDTVISLLEQEGYYPIQWDCDSVDWQDPTPQQMLEKIMSKVQNGSIMLFHSGAKNTPAAFPLILDALEAQGYEVVPISQLIYTQDYTIDYMGRQHSKSE